MPRGDGTGPWWGHEGWGCRRRGYNAGYGRGFGRGMGIGPAAYNPDNRQEDPAGLEEYANRLASELDAVRKRIAELEKK